MQTKKNLIKSVLSALIIAMGILIILKDIEPFLWIFGYVFIGVMISCTFVDKLEDMVNRVKTEKPKGLNSSVH